MSAEHFEILAEEPSMEAFLEELLPKMFHDRATFTVHPHQGKQDLLHKLLPRLRAYARWLPANVPIIVIVDRDDDDCAVLKKRLEDCSISAGLTTRRSATTMDFQVVNRIAIEELEAWFFGEWEGVRRAYPKVAASIPAKAQYRNCDAITGGTWEALERIMKRAGYFSSGYRKVEAARKIGRWFNPLMCTSYSFAALRETLIEAITCEPADGVV